MVFTMELMLATDSTWNVIWFVPVSSVYTLPVRNTSFVLAVSTSVDTLTGATVSAGRPAKVYESRGAKPFSGT
jgi:hypothetical protein